MANESPQDSYGGYDPDRFIDKVDPRLECGICLKVLKDPVQCSNEHYFCRSCVERSLRETSEVCPTCQHHLTKETLDKPARILIEMLQDLIIKCDNESRGCQEVIKLEFLDRHVQNCGYSPTRCSNAGCKEVINRHDKQRHELELCQFRKIDCDECGEQVTYKPSRVHPCFMRKEIDELTRRLDVMQKDIREVKLTQEEMAHLAKDATERCDLFTGRQKIFVSGGWNGETRLRSVESYSWPENVWTIEAEMNDKREGHSAFVHGRAIYVNGGWTAGNMATDSVESLNVDEVMLEWQPLFNMPIKCAGHRTVCHENSVILTGGRDGNNVSDGVYKVGLNPPHEVNLLTQMPEPRNYHGCEIVDGKVIMAGGKTSKYVKDNKNTVYLYDINNNACHILSPLPFSVAQMATVSYKDNLILIGGVNERGETLSTVAMYDIKTGETKMLPRLNYKRAESTAVIAGNVIIVMGGYDYQTDTCLKSVECLDLNTNVWRELSPMKTKRGDIAAVLKPIS